MEKRLYSGLDVGKLICSLLVLIMHSLGGTLGIPGRLFVRNISSVAVPYFFIVSGYLFAGNYISSRTRHSYCVRYVKRIFALYFFWASIYLMLKLPQYYEQYGSDLLYLGLFIIRKIFFVGMGVYWYFLALGESVLIICLFNKCKKERLLFILSTALLLVGVAFNGFRPFFSQYWLIDIVFNCIYLLFSWTNNALFMGLFYVGIGFLIKCKSINIGKKNGIIVLFFSVILKYCESILSISNAIGNNELILFQSTEAIGLFFLMVNVEPIKNKINSIRIRNFSTTVFLLHSIFLFFIDDTQTKNGVYDFFLVFCLCGLAELLLSQSKSKIGKFIFSR